MAGALSRCCPEAGCGPAHCASLAASAILPAMRVRRRAGVSAVVACLAGATIQSSSGSDLVQTPARHRPDMSVQPPSEIDALQDLHERVTQVTGLDRRDCGNFIRRSARDQAATIAQLESAVVCAQAAASEHVAFWFGTGGFVVESWQVEGLLAGPNGILQHFVYNSFGPSFRATRCSRPQVAEPMGLARWIVCGTND